LIAVTTDELIELATKARRKAYTPYSGFPVGAALLTTTGRVYTGCNIENSSFSLTLCAERVAVASAIAAGETGFAALAVVADIPGTVTPCGACRQFLAEFGDMEIIMANLKGERRTQSLLELLPEPFSFQGPTMG